MNYYETALTRKAETIAHRRYFHTNAEVGLNLPKTCAYVTQILRRYGLNPQPCGHGITATIGHGGKCILLRADMDALPMREESGESFACPTGTEAHTCGHDFHTAMLLTAAAMLKENENALRGTVKLMFQPAEETLQGAENMVQNGILCSPKPDAALACHVTAGHAPVGTYLYNSGGTMMFSTDSFQIQITGKGAHGAYPHSSIDPINIAVHIYLALEALIARETDPAKACIITVGKFHAGSASNIIPDTALMEGSIRTNDNTVRKLLVQRVQETAAAIAQAYGGHAETTFINKCPPLICDSKLTDELVGYIQEMHIPGALPYPDISASASEDFSVIAEHIPSAFFYLSAGYPDERGDAPAHNAKVRFNEDVCPIGAAILAHCAEQWLKNNS
ncbi:MAG: amidohydrolase [Oscillospiraceae bacterium]|nr:amidohydrolase [Oscillospiraceae bacterium]